MQDFFEILPKLNVFKLQLNNRFQDLLTEEETTMENDQKVFEEPLTLMLQQVPGGEIYHHRERTSIDTLDRTQEKENNMTEINDSRTRAQKVKAQFE